MAVHISKGEKCEVAIKLNNSQKSVSKPSKNKIRIRNTKRTVEKTVPKNDKSRRSTENRKVHTEVCKYIAQPHIASKSTQKRKSKTDTDLQLTDSRTSTDKREGKKEMDKGKDLQNISLGLGLTVPKKEKDGTDDVLVRCDGYIIHCLGDRRLSKAQYETKKTGTDDVLVQCDGYIIHCLSDRRLSKAQYETKKTGTDDLLVRCDGYIIHCLSDRRLSKAQYETKETGTDDVLVHCDGYIIHCLSDRRLSKAQYETKITEDQVICNTINEREELAATVKTIENGKFAENSLIILNRCVRYGYGLCCRLLFKYNESLYSNHCLMTAFNKSIHLSIKASDDPEKARHVDTAKAIAWQITRMFYINQKDQHVFTNIYPAFKCICENKTCTEIFCSDDLFIVVEVSNYIPTLTINYEGIKIYQQYTRDTLSEGLLISQQQQLYLLLKSCSVALLHGVSWAFANQCFINYSNLISIVPSFLRSKRFNSEKHTFTVEKCATFTCRVKGLIPIGERHFPDLVKASDGTIVQTDVIEGRVNHANLMVGDHIESTTMSGTLGGYLLYYTRKCFMTCAHVMLDEQSMISRTKYPIHNKDLRVFVKDEHGRRIECGTALRCDFETGSDTKSGIDVAIIEMNAQCKVNPNSMVEDKAKNLHSFLYLGMSDEYLNDNCINHELLTSTSSQVETMAFGRLTTIENCKTEFEPEQIIEIELKKLGQAIAVANGNPTFPVMIAQPAHFQMSQGSLPATKTFRMYNQLCLNVPLVPGDSGTCIYIRNCPRLNVNVKCNLSDTNGECPHSGCIGMAIAFSNGMSIVTPMKKIFEHIS